MAPTMKYEKSLLEPSLLLDMYFPKSGILLPLDSLPLKGLVYEALAAPPAGRMAVVLRAAARTAAGLATLAERRHRREAVERDAIVVEGVEEGRVLRGWLRD